MPTIEDLRQYQSQSLECKVAMTQNRIREWVKEFWRSGVYVSFSGGKDSTVLLHLVRELYPEIEAVFVDTGLEYPEIRSFVKTFDNVTTLRPKMRFDEVITKYGYPIISKEVAETICDSRKHINGSSKYVRRLQKLNGERIKSDGKPSPYNIPQWKPLLSCDYSISSLCCSVMKKAPVHDFEKIKQKTPIIGMLAEESLLRRNGWLKSGCNAFSAKRPTSNPMSFWTEQDVLKYIKQTNTKICSVYGEIVYASEPEQVRMSDLLNEPSCDRLATTGCDRTGCMFCGFGCHLEKSPNRFERLKVTHPKQYAYCIGGGEYSTEGLWVPNKKGLGMGHVFDEVNRIYQKELIKY